ncbi:MAG: hypothetical protein ACP5VE_14960 [Chthonomonadales bacterium]
MGDLTGIVAVVMTFGIPLAAILTYHHRRVLEMKLKLRDAAGQDVQTGLANLRQELSDLRDTATRYDLSFDAALQRIEARIGRLEHRVQFLEQSVGSTQSEAAPARRLEI